MTKPWKADSVLTESEAAQFRIDFKSAKALAPKMPAFVVCQCFVDELRQMGCDPADDWIKRHVVECWHQADGDQDDDA
jgi:hypothetical protein